MDTGRQATRVAVPNPRPGGGPGSDRKVRLQRLFDEAAPVRAAWKARFPTYHREIERLCRSLVPAGATVLEVGCGTGDLLHAVRPSRGVGVDLSPGMVNVARRQYPDLEFRVGDVESLEFTERFDYVILSDVVGHLDDVWTAFRKIRSACHGGTRVVLTYYSHLWEPVIRLAERVGLKMPQEMQNWLPPQDLVNLAVVTGYEPLKQGHCLLCPVGLPLVAALANRVLVHLPALRRLALVHYLVMRPEPAPRLARSLTCSVVVPCRNEVGNIRQTAARIPSMGPRTEVVFVDGDSTDGTMEAIRDAIEASRGEGRDIRVVSQVPATGKGDAVRRGVEAASGDVMMILDADLSVMPEDLAKFYTILAEGRAEFVNGSRLVYPMEGQAMRFLNLLANKLFGALFSWLLEQRIRDTLCGTKALLRRDYHRIADHRSVFGLLDPFGDFDLLFGAANLSLKIAELPVRYHERRYGRTKIRRFYHGWLLLKMFVIGLLRLRIR
jgi:SAM-dependent methyltransferase